jgi:hypothetical protein
MSASRTKESLGEKIQAAIGNLPPEGVTLAEIRDLFGQDGLLLFTVFLTIPFMIPISIPGVSTVLGLGILCMGISRILGRNLWLPKKIEQRVLPADKLRVSLTRGLDILHKVERLTRPHRMDGLTSGGLIGVVNNGSLILGAVLLMAPFGLIPFTNTLPGLALLFLAVGLLECDGVCILLGYLSNFATIAYFALLIAGGGTAIHGIAHRLTVAR